MQREFGALQNLPQDQGDFAVPKLSSEQSGENQSQKNDK